jgi:CMP-N-acetylneuraminic acid synthetase
MRILSIIPARAGSKRLPGKNILPLAGKPVIQWTIEAAIASACLTKIVVSSDDPRALQVARACGVAGLDRPPELATDTAKTTDVVSHVIDVHARQGEHFDAIMLLQPTSPLRSADDIRAARQLFVERSAGSVVSLCPAEHPPLLMTTIGTDGALGTFYASLRNIPHRSQDMPAYCRLNGALYIVKTEQYLQHRTLFCDPGFAYIMPAERSVDIDTKIDLFECEALVNRYKQTEAKELTHAQRNA